jgi:ArsR family transcriptional regulator, lead/cadmium/zinc/bismuth-responsive transcriptional repressor
MPNYKFIYNPMYDYLMSLEQLVNHTCMDDEAAEAEIVTNQELIGWRQNMEKKLPRSVLAEAAFFFRIGLMPGLVALDIVRRENVADLATLIDHINAMSPQRFLLGMLENVFCDPDPETGAAYTEETVPTELDVIRAKIATRFPLEKEEVDLFLDACKNPVDSQERLVRLLRKYEAYYRESGQSFEEVSLDTHRRFSETWGQAPERFLEDILSSKTEFFSSDQTVYFSPSFFLDICVITFIYSGEFGVRDSFVVYGTGVERRKWFKARKTRRKLLFKSLSEDNRFEIVKRLAKRDYYLLELANDLSLTSATASHHLDFLMQLEVVEMKREGNKVFFSLKKELLADLFKEALQEILQQEAAQ